MRYLNKITDRAYQQFFLTGNVGQRIVMTLRYLPTQQQWSMDLENGDFILNGIVVTNCLNMLYNYSNIISFGFACITSDGLDPSFANSFSTQSANLYLLDADDISYLKENVFT